MNRSLQAVCLFAFLSSLSSVARAHGLEHTVSHNDAIVITITHEGGAPFADQHYQVFRGDETVAFQTGRTDARGCVVFVPDQGGTWRVRAFSEDGHGIDIDVNADTPQRGAVAETDTRPLGRGSRLLAALSLLFGMFGVVTMLYRRRRS